MKLTLAEYELPATISRAFRVSTIVGSTSAGPPVFPVITNVYVRAELVIIYVIVCGTGEQF